MYKKIRNPENNKLININSKLGHIILKKYLYSLYGGNPEKNVFMPDEGWVPKPGAPASPASPATPATPATPETPDALERVLAYVEETSPETLDSDNVIQRIITEVDHFNVNGIDRYSQTHQTLLNTFNYFDNNINETVNALIRNPRFRITPAFLARRATSPLRDRDTVVRSLRFDNH